MCIYVCIKLTYNKDLEGVTHHPGRVGFIPFPPQSMAYLVGSTYPTVHWRIESDSDPQGVVAAISQAGKVVCVGKTEY